MRRRRVLSILAEVLRTRAWLPVLVYAGHLVLSRVLHAYQAVPPLDMPVHTLGGFAMGYFFDGLLQIAQTRGASKRVAGSARLLQVFALVCTTTVLWELAEGLSDQFLGTYARLAPENTLLDILLGIVGGIGYLGWRVVAEHPSRDE